MNDCEDGGPPEQRSRLKRAAGTAGGRPMQLLDNSFQKEKNVEGMRI